MAETGCREVALAPISELVTGEDRHTGSARQQTSFFKMFSRSQDPLVEPKAILVAEWNPYRLIYAFPLLNTLLMYSAKWRFRAFL